MRSCNSLALLRLRVQEFNRDTLDTAIALASSARVSSARARNETDIWRLQCAGRVSVDAYHHI
jgi:hypothetical protein